MSDIEQVLAAPIEADEDPTSIDDGYSTGLSSGTTSVTSSIRKYIEENGRTYHRYKEGKYLSPNDEAERDRLDFYHAVQLEIMKGRLFLAPLPSDVQRILDCGTGTGIWAMDMGELYPGAEVIGIDLSPIQPDWVPANVKFQVDDLEDEWTFPENHFDFIHSRTLISGIRDLPRYLKQLYKHARPGGYFEFSESGFDMFSDDGTLTPETAVSRYFTLFHKSAKKAGLFLPTEHDIARWATEAGFVDVEIKRLKQPWGPWAKDKWLKQVGRMCASAISDGLEAYALGLFTRYGEKTEEEARKICKDAVNECVTRSGVHAYNYLWHVYGRKPETPTD